MWLNDGILILMAGFMAAGAIDYSLLQNRLGLGGRFKEAFHMMGPLALAMVGIISLAPVISSSLSPVVTPFFEWIGADPAMFASMLLAIDMGAYPLSEALADDSEAAVFSWAFLGTMMGPTLVFTIPIALTIIQKEDQRYFARGILIGLMTIPLGCLIGGALAGYEVIWMIQNLLPTVVLAAFIGAGLWKFTNVTITLFSKFGKGIEIVIMIGLVSVIIETLTDITIIPGLASLNEGVEIVGRITVTLAGAYPLVAFINQKGEKLWERLSSRIGINSVSMTGFIASLAHHLPMFATMKDMNPKGKIMNAAFAVSGAFAFGSHIGFVAGVEKDVIAAVMAGKLSAGLLAVWLAWSTSPEN
ncbi:ethanolamine utilization protein EutH [Halobacillus sp. A5]|uniref:ethanolamine utilization protein EutH n=1 Tax=Halobacillus sp. A5 TaxID=2880263 RepID=UPI0020A69AF3|nr:ethanolamine utilization protein EutH [Halobacillus sp. A5]MCP3029124.1 ethanolamine utilization protein EutH [Halobacillus sp. A5]